MRLSDSQLTTIRERPQRTRLYLSIFQPREVFRARVNNASAARGDRSIPYDTVTLGSIADIESGMTLLVGTTAGAQDVGKIRIKSVNGSAFSVSENSNVKWQDNLYLTVLRYWELWPIFPRIISDPADDENVIFYKDYDTVYTNQNSILGTFPCAGDHQALFRGEQVYYTNSGTVNLLGDTLNHNWSFEGGTPTGSASATPGLVTYNTPGHYVTRYIVSGSSGGVDTTYRYVSVYDRPGEGSSPPIIKWEVSGLGGSRDEGGYQASFRVYENVPIDENSVVVLFGEDWYGNTKQSFGGNSPNNEKIFFVGHVLRNSIRHNWKQSYTEFSVGSITEVMKQALGFSVSVESKASPSTWYELLDMDCRRAIYHYLKWHTTALSIADFQFLGDDYKIQFFDADRTSMYDAIDNLLRNTLIGKVVADRRGKVWMEIDAKAYQNPTGSFSSVMDITKRDWMNEPIIDQEFSDRLSYLEMGGIAYSGVSTGTFSALLACAPGSAPSFRGSIEMPDGLAILGQSQLNQMVGNIFANQNSRLPKIAMEMAGNYRNLDIAPQEAVHMNILATDTVAETPVDGLYIPDNINWNYNARNQILLPNIDFVNLVNGDAGETIGIPQNVDDAGFDSGGFSVPQLQIPPLPVFTVPSFPAGLTTGSSCCDYFAALGVGAGVFCDTSTQDLQGVSNCNTPQASEFLVSFDYSSNLQMYNIQQARLELLNTGTITYYINLEAMIVPNAGNCASILVPVLYDASTGLPYSPRPLNDVLIQSGCNQALSETKQASMSISDARMKYPNYIKLHLQNGVCGTCDGNCDSSYTSNWQSIKLRICNSP